MALQDKWVLFDPRSPKYGSGNREERSSQELWAWCIRGLPTRTGSGRGILTLGGRSKGFLMVNEKGWGQ